MAGRRPGRLARFTHLSCAVLLGDYTTCYRLPVPYEQGERSGNVMVLDRAVGNRRVSPRVAGAAFVGIAPHPQRVRRANTQIPGSVEYDVTGFPRYVHAGDLVNFGHDAIMHGRTDIAVGRLIYAALFSRSRAASR